MGFAHPHSNPIPLDIKTNYDAFKWVIDHIIRRKPKSHVDMLTHHPYSWFPKILMDQRNAEFTLNGDRLRVIFVLLQYFEEFRSTLEQQQLSIFNIIAPGQLDILRNQNAAISASVVEYMRQLPGNPHLALGLGGRRHHRYYYQYARKQTKINKNSSNVRRRKSQKQRRRKSIHSKRCRK